MLRKKADQSNLHFPKYIQPFDIGVDSETQMCFYKPTDYSFDPTGKPPHINQQQLATIFSLSVCVH